MIHTIADDPGSLTPAALRERYEAELRGVVEEFGAETVAERTDIDRERIDAIVSDDLDSDLDGDLQLLDAASVLSLRDGAPSAEAIEAESRDVLLMGMTSAVLDVDTLEGEIDGQIEARAIQQKIEGRFPMTLGEYALLQQAIEERTP